ncbi:MAG: ADP-ribosylglycohydrolase family protein [Erysipelotrichaceae bacterium]|nr:ADP-ribosylglycohydrolase family protein [Erysipelotrichaceae bacterium]
MKLRIEDKHEYLEKVYASWLGKLIGIRLGSPVEGWSHEKIMADFGDKEGYLVDYDIYAADDDSNGPLFFVRALLDEEELTTENIGDCFLNYLQEYRGFFWWGGVGVSTEHTAYENLKNGIKAPKSGSVEQNGQAIAEQIGGQIFSDCWGYVAGYDIDLAKKLAAMASSVTHDRCGIEGGIFVATAIALAMQKDDIHEVIDEALEYLNKDLEYYQVAKDIIRFYKENKTDWQECLKYIQDNYGYDKYPGVCHIIPNTALMVMAMCYGENDFDKTLTMLNRSGWDTDCNCGNVGSIMGALLGLDGIDEKWIRPINDIVNASSAIGYLNIQTVSDSAALFTKLAYKLHGMEVDYEPFELPYATKGIRTKEGNITVGDNKLYVEAKDAYKYVYYLSDDLYDARYDPQFSPFLYPGDKVIIDIEGGKNISTYVGDCEGKISFQKQVADNKLIIEMPLRKNVTIHKAGIISDEPYYIKDIQIERKASLDYDFKAYPLDHYGPRYGGDYMSNIRGFVEHSGTWKIEEGLLGISAEHALISSGAYGEIYEHIEWEFIPEQGKEHMLVFNMQGYLHHYKLGLNDDSLVLIEKNKQERIICSYPLVWEEGVVHKLKIDKKEKMLEVLFDEKEYFFPYIELKDLFGITLGKDCIDRTISLSLY